ncbi:MAG: N-acetylmuramoyl-L-alanine amidase [Bacteroidales bacterium]|nr:N-acetylmuramoyl-L-alanine amidase [Bacteroidales bacterium]
MSTGIKNGKLHTNNILVVKLIFLFIAFIIVSGSASALKNDKGWVIVIDAGHGGKDPGAVGSFSYEKNITLAIALRTGEYIEQNIKNVTVIYTRKNDTFVELRDRANIANKNNADLFISIHANWAKSKNIQGTETFIMGLAKNDQNFEVAKKENEVILLEDDFSTKYEGFDSKSPESYIMFTLMQNIFQEQSTGLASKIQTQYKEKIYRTDRGVKQAGFWVLFMTTMPSVLTETGFITNPSEEKYLNSKQGQDYLSSALFKACRDYISEIDSKSGMSPEKNQNPEPEPDISTPVISPAGEIVFMVQIASFSSKNEVNPRNFNGLTDVVELDTQDRFRYVTGSFTDYSAAVRYRKKIEAVYPDAFIIAVKDNKILPLQQALEQKNKK